MYYFRNTLERHPRQTISSSRRIVRLVRRHHDLPSMALVRLVTSHPPSSHDSLSLSLSLSEYLPVTSSGVTPKRSSSSFALSRCLSALRCPASSSFDIFPIALIAASTS